MLGFWKVEDIVQHVWTGGKYMVLEKTLCPFTESCNTYHGKPGKFAKDQKITSCDGKMLKLLQICPGKELGGSLLNVRDQRCPVYFQEVEDETDEGTSNEI